MFTSKKALYLNKDFERISPITNIDSLYYERAEKVKDSSYKIHRMSVAKHMPIRFIVNSSLERDIDVCEIPNPIINNISLGPIIKNASVNINYIKFEVPNKYDSISHKTTYDISLYNINSSININLLDYLRYYSSVDYFNTSVYNINLIITNDKNDIDNISTYVHNTSNYADSFIGYTTNNDIITYNLLNTLNPNNNTIYKLLYHPYIYSGIDYISNASFIIKVQCVSTDIIKNYVSLDITDTFNNDTSFVKKWQIHYNISNNIITYLKDEYGNEGNFDFKNHFIKDNYTIYNNQYINSSVKNNYFYFNPKNAIIRFANKDKTYVNNKIYNSTCIIFGINTDANNNYVFNTHGAIINGDSNKIYNSKNNGNFNNITSCNASLNINGNNNIIINCEDCSINITGNNNILINLCNLNLNLTNNNIIISDIAGCETNNKILSNNKLFLNQSSSTAIAYDLIDNYTVFGGIGNDVSVYGLFITTNK